MKNSKKKEKDKGIFDGIRKPMPPPSKRYKSNKGKPDRKKKHKGEDENGE